MFPVLLIVILGCLSQRALGCSCSHVHPQSAYCNSAVVIRGKFVAQTDSEKREHWNQYRIKTTKVFKAPEDMGDIEVVHTSKTESLCGYEHKSTNRSEEFLITGSIVDGMVVITACGFIAPWDSLTIFQKKGFSQMYEKGCSCQIVPCYSVPCEVTSDQQCLWTDHLMQRSSTGAGSQASSLACLDMGKGLCTWETQKSRLLTTIRKSKAH
ncbi:metalloproteinase inhibitor 1 [Spea bombifrons]|uniref:metalloproteinase inhibitor 1 n=1 Tax=Spea bombifrons TaxID=233779 RepID=UPI00234980CD|nr:metalloproteinase inhibitor 1 [Spea bombifrons]